MSSTPKRQNLYWISCLRLLAMIMVITPHLLMYNLENLPMRYFRYYILNPLNIISGMGAIGVSIFFLAGGYLSRFKVGKGNYIERFYKSVLMILAEATCAMIFSWLFQKVIGIIFIKYGVIDNVYAAYNLKDWLESGLLLRSFFSQETTDGVLWFLIPFLIYKTLFLLFEAVFPTRPERYVWIFWAFLAFIRFALCPLGISAYYITDRSFYIGIILIGYIFSLQNEIGSFKMLQYLFLNGVLMLSSLHLCWIQIEEGYIVSALYATIIFYVFKKFSIYLKPNKVVLLAQEVGLSFFLLHFNIGTSLILLFYRIIIPGKVISSLILAVTIDLLIIIAYHFLIQKRLNKLLLYLYNVHPFMENTMNTQIKNNTSRENNFDAVRMIGALMVMSGHMAFISGSYTPLVLFGVQIQSVGVYIFFLLGGYLISLSWKSDPHPLRYACKRFFRIWPPLAVYCLFAIFIAGPLFSELPIKDYFTNPGLKYYFMNMIFFPIYGLPGLFGSNPYPNAVNGSLWTLPVEVALYVIIPLCLFLVMKSRKNFFKIWMCITIIVCGAQILHMVYKPDLRLVIYGSDLAQAMAIVPYYFIGVLYTQPEVKSRLNIQTAVVLAFIMSCIKFNIALGLVAQYLAIPYIIFSICLIPSPKFAHFFEKFECSYGLYLYGFLIQQCVVFMLQKYSITFTEGTQLLISVVITFVFAIASYKFIEKPCIVFSKKLMQKFKKNDLQI